MMTSPSKATRVASGIVCAFFAAFVLIHLLWAVGITWGLDVVSGGEAGDNELTAGIALTFASLIGAAAGAAAIFVTATRAGWHRTRLLSDRMLQFGAWVVFSWPAIGSLNPATTWGQRAVAVPLAMAALVAAVAHVDRSRSPSSRAATPARMRRSGRERRRAQEPPGTRRVDRPSRDRAGAR